ncbi:hypothetical protein V6N11_082959 [Hibiscus sabdariffa]|uniref:Cytochrome P450 n=1 Tax=Hibiscus sabdariffa TaxID=183260 RepID=A0ABR2QKG2_9ROSI
MSVLLGRVSTIIVSSPVAAELFLRTHDAVFAGRPKLQISKYLTYGPKRVVFVEYGPYWRTVRKWFSLHLVSASTVESFAPVRKEELSSLVESLRKVETAGETVDLSRKGLTRRLKRTSNDLHAFFDKIIDEHEQGTKHEEQKPYTDFVNALVSLLDTPMNPKGEEQASLIDRKNIKAIMVDMVAASFDTTTTAIEWTLSELLRHPRVMAGLQQELERVVGRNRMVEESDLPKLTCLDMVIKESFRLHPVAPFLIPHESTEDIIVNGYFIPKKSRIMVNTWSMGRDRKVWSDDAEEFFPERFKDGNIDLRGHDFELIPFGSGRRGCPGMQLGLCTMRLIIAQLVHCFNWELPDGMLPGELDMTEKFGLSLPRANHLIAKPTYRLLG